MGIRQTRFEDKPGRESVSPAVTAGVGIGRGQEIQLESLILAQPERCRRG